MKEYKYKINGNTYRVAVGDIENGMAQVTVNGTPYDVELEKTAAPAPSVKKPRPAAPPTSASGEKVVKKAAPAAASEGKAVKAPLPGVILSIDVKVGDTVKAADTVMVLEAMKMENAIHAGVDGTVASIDVNAGDSVLEGNVLMTIK